MRTGVALCCALLLGCGDEVVVDDRGAGGGAGGAGGGAAGGGGEPQCTAGSIADLEATGVHFALIEIDYPVTTQLQLFLAADDRADGLVLRLTDADRDPSCDGSPCPAGEGCGPAGCVSAEEPASSLDERPFFLPNPDPPTGYGTTFSACVYDEDGVLVLRSAQFDIVIENPAVTIRDTTIALTFDDSNAPLEAQGTFQAQDMILGETPSGPAAGGISSRRLAEEEVPEGVPRP